MFKGLKDLAALAGKLPPGVTVHISGNPQDHKHEPGKPHPLSPDVLRQAEELLGGGIKLSAQPFVIPTEKSRSSQEQTKSVGGGMKTI